jgi:Fe-S-cluster containining protein
MAHNPETVTGNVHVALSGVEFDMQMTVPAGQVKLRDLLPVLRNLTNGLVEIATDATAQAGKPVSCTKGCGECCRMAVPVSLPEAYRLREVIEAMPEPRQSEIRGRFVRAVEHFRNKGLLDKVFAAASDEDEEQQQMRVLEAYQAEHIPCPFLEDESCSIYEERPLICRQFLVTSPAQNCANIDGRGVERLPIVARPSDALIIAEHGERPGRPGAIPLIRVLEYTATNPERAEEKSGPQWMQLYLKTLKERTTEVIDPRRSFVEDALAKAFDAPQNLAARLPKAAVKPQGVLPILQELTDAVVANAEANLAAEGKQVSCQKGCGACCRQVVPISVPEAYHLRDVVASLPEPRQTAVRERFAAGVARLRAAGVLDPIASREAGDRAQLAELGLAYFYAGVPCPFLEEESCTIHADRPLACREYLVSSPAAHCANPSPETIERVKLGGSVSEALMLAAPGPRPQTPFVPLILALEFAEANPDTLPEKAGVRWLDTVVTNLKRGR